jgi:DNA-directed RNA polymerase subunit RPC12/RpoP
MGLIKCLDCDRHVSLNADHCPHCGNKRFREQYFERQKRWEEEDKIKLAEDNKKAKNLGFSNAYEMHEKQYQQRKKSEEFWNGLYVYIFLLVVILVVFILFI